VCEVDVVVGDEVDASIWLEDACPCGIAVA
jgi:hypothetical protein